MSAKAANNAYLLKILRKKDVSSFLCNSIVWKEEVLALESNSSMRPFMPSLAKTYLQKYKGSSLFLLPIYLQKGKLYLCEFNAAQIRYLVVSTSLFESTSLDKVYEISLENPFPFLNADFFHKFLYLTQLKIHNEVTDTTLERLATCLPNLTLFDCSKDPVCQITDYGLGWLGRLKRLRHVFLKRCHPGKDHSMPNYTGIGIALLMKSLPALVKITFHCCQMLEALNSLVFSQSVLPSLKSLDLTRHHFHSNVFSIVGKTCPYLDRLSITVRKEKEVLTCALLRNFQSIEELHVNQYETNVTISLFISYVGRAFGKHLKVLDIITINLTFQEVCELSSTCPNLKRLTIFVNTKMGEGGPAPVWNPVHQKLESLDYSGLDLQCLEAFLQSTSELVKLYIICPKDGNADVLKNMDVRERKCPKLKTLRICLPETMETMRHHCLPSYLATIFCSLKRIVFINPRKDVIKTFKSVHGNEVFVEAVKGILHPDYNELDYLDG